MFHAVRGGAARTERSLLTSRLAGATRGQGEVSLMGCNTSWSLIRSDEKHKGRRCRESRRESSPQQAYMPSSILRPEWATPSAVYGAVIWAPLPVKQSSECSARTARALPAACAAP